VKHHILY